MNHRNIDIFYSYIVFYMQTACDNNVGRERTRRDTKDNEIDEISCGTSIKVANRHKTHNLKGTFNVFLLF